MSQKNARATCVAIANVDTADLLSELEEYLDRNSKVGGGFEQTERPQRQTREKGMLGVFGTDLTARAKAGKLDPVIGRKEQEERLVTILSRRTKNNPVLIGEPGVGKTAIVEGLAQRIYDEDVPEHLLDKRIIQLDLAGT